MLLARLCFAFNILMCVSKDKYSSIYSPKYLTQDVGISLIPSNNIFMLGIGIPFLRKTINSILEEFREILLALSQLSTDFRSAFNRLTIFWL